MNHCIIGLGGTGGKIIRAFRKTIYQEFRQKDPTIKGVGLRYLYVDSSGEMMKADDESWKIFGESVQLGPTSQLKIGNADLAGRLADLQSYPGIRHWIGSERQWLDILKNNVDELLGGQKRRLGRFLFSCKAPDFRGTVADLVRDMEKEAALKGCYFHVCCGLAGGTGSGSVIDVVSQLRDYFHEKDIYRIRIYAFVPQSAPPQDWPQENYLANSYAALLELNALSLGSFVPHDVTGRSHSEDLSVNPSDRNRYNPAKLVDPFSGCYLYTDVIETNEEKANYIQVDFQTLLPQLVADFLYQKIIVARQIAIPELDKMENVENRTDNVEYRDNPDVLLRSKRFLTFGIKRLAIPEEEIREYLVFRFAKQAALQMNFNYFPQNSRDGFADASTRNSTEFESASRFEENLSRWKISDEHLKLSLGILPDDVANKEWKTITNEWKTIGPAFKDLARQKRNTEWLDTLATFYEERFERKFRKMGVKEFYRVKLKAKFDIVREVRKTIESELFAAWRNGQSSLYDTKQLLAALITGIQERLSSMETNLQREREKEQMRHKQVEATAHADAKLGPLGRWWYGQRNFDAQALSLEGLYIARTEIEAIGFAKLLLAELITELNALKADVDDVFDTINNGATFFNTNANSRCSEDTKSSDTLYRFYEPAKVKEIADALIKDENGQKQQASVVRKVLVDELGDKQTFAQFRSRIGRNKFIDICQIQCKKNVEQKHDEYVAANGGKGRLFGINIIEKIEESYRSGSEEFRKFINDEVKKSGLLMEFNQTEMGRNPANVKGVAPPSYLMLVIRPKDPEREAFIKELEQEIKTCSRGACVFVDAVGRRNEITFIRMANCFPLRFIKPLPFLKEAYDRRINSNNSERARLELHLEDERSHPYPPLFVPQPNEIRRMGLPYVLIGKALTLVKPYTDPQTGKDYLAYEFKDSEKFDKVALFGQTLAESWNELDEDKSELIKYAVETELVNRMRIDKLQTIQDTVRSDVNEILKRRGASDQDLVCRELRDAGRRAMDYLGELQKKL